MQNPETTPQDFKNRSPTLQLNKNHTTLYVPLQFIKYENKGLLDTATYNALFEAESIKSLHALSEVPLDDSPYRISNYQMLIVISSRLEASTALILYSGTIHSGFTPEK